ncbi:unnamed protein product [Brassica napus]|uniref:(rape) hypothetical protein n=1 Tax=Brassica napus TaxID=3708 RepID=A0A816K7L2_BRANA|nr:unnamed protein product [Brassica napus]
MKSSHLSTLPETISNHGRSPLLTLSVLPFHPGIVKPRTCGSMLSMKNLQLDPTYAEPLEPDLLVNLVLGFSQFGGCVRALLYLVSPLRRIESPTPATASIQLPLASSHVFMPPIIHPTLRQLHPTKVSMELSYID